MWPRIIYTTLLNFKVHLSLATAKNFIYFWIMFHLKLKRILLKLSGESLKGDQLYGQDYKSFDRVSDDILEVVQQNIQICIVVGGGNICRGRDMPNLEKSTADYIAMLSTVMNALMLQSTLRKKGLKSKVLSSIPMETICETYSKDKALDYLGEGKIVIFAGGTGNPFMSTDTLAVYRAIEMECDAMLKGTQVSGVYSSDPRKNLSPRKYETLKYDDILDRKLEVMDLPPIYAARDHKLLIIIFCILKRGELSKVLKGKGDFTVIG